MFSWLQVVKRLFNIQNDPLFINGATNIKTHAYGELAFADTCHQPGTYGRKSCGGSILKICISPSATFVAIYDGHGSNEISTFMSRHFFNHFINNYRESGCISEEVLKETFLGIEAVAYKEHITTIPRGSSSCLVVFVWKGIVYVLNSGDSRAVLGSSQEMGGTVINGPFTCSKNLEENDNFLIVATSGFWSHVSIDQAIECVEANVDKRAGIATKLCRLAREMIPLDDTLNENIQVVVLYFDKTYLESENDMVVPDDKHFEFLV